jgi:GNAT superfamily N-acetyltransferase
VKPGRVSAGSITLDGFDFVFSPVFRSFFSARRMPMSHTKKNPDEPLFPRCVWSVGLERFRGWGCMVSETFAIDARNDDDGTYEHIWDAEFGSKPIWRSADGLGIHPLIDWEPPTVVLVSDGQICGFDMGGQLWLDPEFRGKGLGAELVLALAEFARKCPADLDGLLGYSDAGMAAHEKAWKLAIERAVADGRNVPRKVLVEFEEAGHGADSMNLRS